MEAQSTFFHMKKILVPLDGSTLAEEALPLAAHLASNCKAEVHLLRVVPPSSCMPIYTNTPIELTQPIREAAFEEAYAYLEQVVTYEQLDTIRTCKAVELGSIPMTIIDYARSHTIDLIVINSRGETGVTRWVMGSTAQQLIRYSPVPILALRDHRHRILPLSHIPRVLIALDGSPLAEEAIHPAANLCAALAAPGHGAVHLMRAVGYNVSHKKGDPTLIEQQNRERRVEAEAYLAEITQRFYTGEMAALHLTVTSSIVTYTSAEDIKKRVLEESSCIGDEQGYTGCDIIAMTTHGRYGFQHLLFGSITESVFDEAPQPLLVINGRQVGKKDDENEEREEVTTIARSGEAEAHSR